MKNINFSPLAKSGKHHRRGNLILGGVLIFLIFLLIVLWHRQVDFSHIPPHGKAPEIESHLELGEGEVAAPKSDFELPKGGVAQPRGESPREEQNFPPESAKVEPVETSTQADKEAESANYYLKVYSGIIKSDAEKVASYLVRRGYSPRIIREPGFAIMRNVYVRPHSSGFQATVDRLSKDGFSLYLQKGLKNQYTIRIGSCYYLESAKSLLKSLKHKGYSGNIVEENTAVRFYSVFLGEYPNFDTALKEQKRLNEQGVATIIVKSE